VSLRKSAFDLRKIEMLFKDKIERNQHTHHVDQHTIPQGHSPHHFAYVRRNTPRDSGGLLRQCRSPRLQRVGRTGLHAPSAGDLQSPQQKISRFENRHAKRRGPAFYVRQLHDPIQGRRRP